METRKEKKKHRWIKAAGITVLAVVLLAAAGRLILFPPYKEPAVTGSCKVAIEEFTWVDKSRVETYTDTGENRALTVKIWYLREEGSYPLVLFSHGAFGVIDSNYSTCMELASNGYVAVSIGHPYHAMFVKDVEGKVTFADPEFIKSIYAVGGTDTPEAKEGNYLKSREWMAVRTGDENFVLDTILAKAKEGRESPFDRIDTDRIGLFGHSMGGASSVQLGREREDIDAVIDLEGTMLGEYVGFKNGAEVYNEEPYPVPLLDINSQAAYEQARAQEKGGLPYVNFYVGEHAADFKEVVFHDAGHLNFTDLPLISPVLAGLLGTGDVDAGTCIGNVNHVVLAWFDHYLKGVPELDIEAEY